MTHTPTIATIPIDSIGLSDERRSRRALVEAYGAALNEVIKNGKYAEVLKRWGLTNESLPKSEINPQGLPKS